MTISYCFGKELLRWQTKEMSMSQCFLGEESISEDTMMEYVKVTFQRSVEDFYRRLYFEDLYLIVCGIKDHLIGLGTRCTLNLKISL